MKPCTRLPHTDSKKKRRPHPEFPGTASALYQYDQMGSQKAIAKHFTARGR